MRNKTYRVSVTCGTIIIKLHEFKEKHTDMYASLSTDETEHKGEKKSQMQLEKEDTMQRIMRGFFVVFFCFYQQQWSQKYNKVTFYNYCKQIRFLYPVKISCKYVEEIKEFSDRQKLRVCALRRPTLQKTREKEKGMIQCGILYL